MVFSILYLVCISSGHLLTLFLVGNLIEKEIFTIYYHTLVNILPVGNILYQLVPVGIISQDDVAEINSNSMPRPKDKASFILNRIGSSLEAGYKSNFYALLDIMEGYCNGDVREAVVDIRRALMTGELIILIAHVCISKIIIP